MSLPPSPTDIAALSELLKQSSPAILELGCGPHKTAGAIGIDSLPLPGVDFVCDLEEGLAFLPKNSLDEVRSRHVLEHIERFEPLMRDVHQALKPNGRQVVVVPHFSNPYYYSDYTHRRLFGLYSFDYFARVEHQLRRKVPAFYTDFEFKVIERQLVFKSPFLLRNLFRQLLNRVFNLNSYMQELYEEVFCYAFPCQEIRFVMVPLSPDGREKECGDAGL